jgi:hypothetical protein
MDWYTTSRFTSSQKSEYVYFFVKCPVGYIYPQKFSKALLWKRISLQKSRVTEVVKTVSALVKDVLSNSINGGNFFAT